MRANELRIGNLVEINAPIKDVIIAVDVYHISELRKNKDSFRPIPLTDEWLEKFKNDTYEFYRQANGRVSLIDDMGEGVVFYIGSCEFAHQLQNLFFALENREIELTTNN